MSAPSPFLYCSVEAAEFFGDKLTEAIKELSALTTIMQNFPLGLDQCHRVLELTTSLHSDLKYLQQHASIQLDHYTATIVGGGS